MFFFLLFHTVSQLLSTDIDQHSVPFARLNKLRCDRSNLSTEPTTAFNEIINEIPVALYLLLDLEDFLRIRDS